MIRIEHFFTIFISKLRQLSQTDMNALKQAYKLFGDNASRVISEKEIEYYENKVIPHKIAVYEAGLDVLVQCRNMVDEDLFVHRLLIHDVSKFTSHEVAYAYHDFQGVNSEEQRFKFEKAWHHHKMANDHHPEYWLSPQRDGSTKPLDMSLYAICEMIADWMGAGKTYGSTLEEWLPNNLNKFCLSQRSACLLSEALGQLKFKTEVVFDEFWRLNLV